MNVVQLGIMVVARDDGPGIPAGEEERVFERFENLARLRAIDAVELEQSAAGRLLGYGTVLVGPLEVEHVPEPKEVTQLVERLCA